MEDEESEKVETAVSPCQWVSGARLVVERLDLHSSLSSEEIEEACLNSLEIHSPFPLEQISWGYWTDREKETALVYATMAKNGALEHGDPFLPSFLPFLECKVSDPKVVTTVNDRTVSLLVFDKAEQLPADVLSVEVEGEHELTDELVRQIRSDIAREWLNGSNPSLEDEIWWYASFEENWKRELTFVSQNSKGDRLETEISPKKLSQADLRDSDSSRKSFNEGRLSIGLWLAGLVSLGILAVCLILSLVLVIWTSQVSAKENRVEEQKPKVLEIEAKSKNLEVFEGGAAARLQPLAMLELVNKVRPNGIYLEQVKAYEGNRIEVEGRSSAQGTALVNEFRQKLENAPFITTVNMQITQITNGITYFRLSLEFMELEVAEVGSHSV
ncbi:MAG: PilN domain-containing protein [Opitutales bacterium]|nr:PilN domain-containing protein [Opitutales bacterium]